MALFVSVGRIAFALLGGAAPHSHINRHAVKPCSYNFRFFFCLWCFDSVMLFNVGHGC